jgi:hypothetical protein
VAVLRFLLKATLFQRVITTDFGNRFFCFFQLLFQRDFLAKLIHLQNVSTAPGEKWLKMYLARLLSLIARLDYSPALLRHFLPKTISLVLRDFNNAELEGRVVQDHSLNGWRVTIGCDIIFS